MWKKKEKPILEFIARIPELTDVEDIQPVPASKFIPKWWKNMPYANDLDVNSIRPESQLVKQCPAFPELFSSGYILPMWADTTLYYDDTSGMYQWRCGNLTSPFVIQIFRPDQFKDHVPYTFEGSKIVAVWQFVNPWEIRTSKGYSLFQLPLFYHFNDDYSVLPGTYDGFNVETNKLEVAFFANKKEIFIKKGTPLVQYVPFKKSTVDLVVREQTNEDIKRRLKMGIQRQTMFKSWYAQNRNRGI